MSQRLTSSSIQHFKVRQHLTFLSIQNFTVSQRLTSTSIFSNLQGASVSPIKHFTASQRLASIQRLTVSHININLTFYSESASHININSAFYSEPASHITSIQHLQWASISHDINLTFTVSQRLTMTSSSIQHQRLTFESEQASHKYEFSILHESKRLTLTSFN